MALTEQPLIAAKRFDHDDTDAVYTKVLISFCSRGAAAIGHDEPGLINWSLCSDSAADTVKDLRGSGMVSANLREDLWSISKICMVAFKSIGKTEVKVSFPEGLSCIVGPNGSGKSNILDAICFACGCSPAILGVQRLSDLQCTETQEVRLPPVHLPCLKRALLCWRTHCTALHVTTHLY